MAHYVTADDGKRSDRYRFGSLYRKDGRGRSALNGVNRFFRKAIKAIADAKLRRMQRELTLRGIRFDQPEREWIAGSLRERGNSE